MSSPITLYIVPNTGLNIELNGEHVERFAKKSSLPANIVTHMWKAKEKFGYSFAFEFFLKNLNFIQSTFSVIFKFMKSGQNCVF